MRYFKAVLINKEGCAFDNASFLSFKKLKMWAKGRGGDYKCRVYVNDDRVYVNDDINNSDLYSIKNDRMRKISYK